jgi:uncharacterized Fe-S radical SAM superfamily protein PflX
LEEFLKECRLCPRECGVDRLNGEKGVTWATVDAPLVEVGAIAAETPWMRTIAPSSTLFSYVMNNYWHTNYKADQEGPTVERLHGFVKESGYELAGAHEEEYLSKPDAKVVRTIVRYPVRRKAEQTKTVIWKVLMILFNIRNFSGSFVNFAGTPLAKCRVGHLSIQGLLLIQRLPPLQLHLGK